MTGWRGEAVQGRPLAGGVPPTPAGPASGLGAATVGHGSGQTSTPSLGGWQRGPWATVLVGGAWPGRGAHSLLALWLQLGVSAPWRWCAAQKSGPGGRAGISRGAAFALCPPLTGSPGPCSDSKPTRGDSVPPAGRALHPGPRHRQGPLDSSSSARGPREPRNFQGLAGRRGVCGSSPLSPTQSRAHGDQRISNSSFPSCRCHQRRRRAGDLQRELGDFHCVSCWVASGVQLERRLSASPAGPALVRDVSERRLTFSFPMPLGTRPLPHGGARPGVSFKGPGDARKTGEATAPHSERRRPSPGRRPPCPHSFHRRCPPAGRGACGAPPGLSPHAHRPGAPQSAQPAAARVPRDGRLCHPPPPGAARVLSFASRSNHERAIADI